MKFKVDENLPVEVADDLVQEGHDALTVKDQQLSGQVDVYLAKICQAEGRALLTLDLDFADIREYPPADYPGLIVLCGLAVEGAIRQIIARVISVLSVEPLVGHLWIVDESQIRIRGASHEPPSTH